LQFLEDAKKYVRAKFYQAKYCGSSAIQVKEKKLTTKTVLL